MRQFHGCSFESIPNLRLSNYIRVMSRYNLFRFNLLCKLSSFLNVKSIFSAARHKQNITLHIYVIFIRISISCHEICLTIKGYNISYPSHFPCMKWLVNIIRWYPFYQNILLLQYNRKSFPFRHEAVHEREHRRRRINLSVTPTACHLSYRGEALAFRKA